MFIPYLFYPLSELFSKSSQVEKYSSETLTRIALPVALTSFLWMNGTITMCPPSLVSASHSAQSNKQRWSSVPAPTAIYLISECHCNKWATRARNIFPARFQRVVSAALTSIFTNGTDFISTSGVDGFASGSKHQLQITLTLWGRSQDAALFLGLFTGSVGARDTYVNKRCDIKKIPDQSVRHTEGCCPRVGGEGEC